MKTNRVTKLVKSVPLEDIAEIVMEFYGCDSMGDVRKDTLITSLKKDFQYDPDPLLKELEDKNFQAKTIRYHLTQQLVVQLILQKKLRYFPESKEAR